MSINQATIIGITGTIGCGKSTVGKILAQLNVPIIDTDKIVHELLDSDDEIKTQIANYFPQAVKTNSAGVKMVDRKQLAGIIFKDTKAKTQLEAILHPRVRHICQQRTQELAAYEQTKIIAVLIPLLFENQLQTQYDQTWAIVADEQVLRQRLMQRDGLSAQEVDLRLAGQMSQEQKAKLANVVLDNSGTEDELRIKVENLVQNLRK